MFRRTLLGTAVAVAALLTPTAAAAATTNTTVVSRFGIPAPLAFNVDANSCGTGPFLASVHHVTGPATPPLGTGSLRLAVGKQSAADLSADVSADNHPLKDLTALSLDVYVPQASASLTKNLVISTTPVSNDYYQLATQLPGSVKEWTPFDALSSSVLFNWTLYDQNGPTATHGTSTYSDFRTAHPSLRLDTVGVSLANCGTTSHSISVDKVTLGLKQATTTVNFEAPITPKLVGHLSAKVVGFHGAVTPTARLTSNGHGIGHQSVALWQKRAGTKRYHKVGTLLSKSSGAIIGPVEHPRVNTSYQWRYAGDHATYAAAQSNPVTVGVRSRVRLALERRSVANGGSVAGGGSVTPRQPKLKLTLWAEKVTGSAKHRSLGKPVKVASTRLRRDGTYTVSGKLGRGHYKVFTTAAADATNAAGRSPSRSFTVRP